MDQVIPFELQSLAQAKRYQSWIYEEVAPFLGNRILELGSGIGNLSQWLPVRELLCLTEIDASLFQTLEKKMKALTPSMGRLELRKLDLLKDDLSELKNFQLDTIVSFNVMEHIREDFLAFQKLWEILKESTAQGPKRLITFVPAHSWAYGSLDREFQHFRRYESKDLKRFQREIAPEAKFYSRYMNTPGLAGWILNGKILKKKEIDLKTIQTFETLCPAIRSIDWVLHRVLHLPLGQSLISVWELDS